MTREEFTKELFEKLLKVNDLKEIVNDKEYRNLLIKAINNKR